MRRDVDAVKDVLRRHGFQAGASTIGLQVCADSTKQAGYWTERRCVANARAYAATPALAGIIGPVHSGCARMQLPVLADAPGGPPPQIGYNTTYLGLTRPGPATAPDEPEVYGTGARRAFVRPAGPDDAQGVALAQLAQRLGASRVVILDDATSHGMPVSRAARAALEAEGIDVISTVWNARAPNYRRVAERIASQRATPPSSPAASARTADGSCATYAPSSDRGSPSSPWTCGRRSSTYVSRPGQRRWAST